MKIDVTFNELVKGVNTGNVTFKSSIPILRSSYRNCLPRKEEYTLGFLRKKSDGSVELRAAGHVCSYVRTLVLLIMQRSWGSLSQRMRRLRRSSLICLSILVIIVQR